MKKLVDIEFIKNKIKSAIEIDKETDCWNFNLVATIATVSLELFLSKPIERFQVHYNDFRVIAIVPI